MHNTASKNALILVAAGRGERAGGDIPKQYQPVAGQALMAHTLLNLTRALDFDPIIIVVAADDCWIDGVVADLKIVARTVKGGETRTESVRNGLQALKGDHVDHVYIHDAARPFVTAEILADLDTALAMSQAAAPSLTIADALKCLDGDHVDRDAFLRIQTPQAFRYADIVAAYDGADADMPFVDDIAVAKAAGLSIAFTQGDEDNFKVTFPQDFAKATRMLDQSTYVATGSGFDVHRICAGDRLWLCGVEMAAGFSLKGHSDADVGLHALTDAILGALAEGDIGDHFPPSDPQWKGASSDRFLAFAQARVVARGGAIEHVDVTVICEKPKVKPHRGAMRARIADILDLPESRVSVKATTTEKLGFTGRGEGIAAQATATLRLPS